MCPFPIRCLGPSSLRLFTLVYVYIVLRMAAVFLLIFLFNSELVLAKKCYILSYNLRRGFIISQLFLHLFIFNENDKLIEYSETHFIENFSTFLGGRY